MNPKALLVVAILAVFGAGIWFALAQRSEAAPGLPTTTAPPLRVGETPASAAAADAPPADANGIAGQATAAERLAVTTPAAPAGPGREIVVTGRLVDGKGAPRAGANLKLLNWRTPEGSLGLEDIPPPPDEQRLERAPATTSDQDGRFRFTSPADRSGRIVLADSDFVFGKREPFFIGNKGDVDLGDILTLRSSAVAGVVRDPRGQPLADVTVAAGFGGGLFLSRSQTRTDAEGRFRLEGLQAGTVHVRTASAKFQPALAEVELGVEEEKTDLVLQVAEGEAIAGQVVDDRGVGVGKCKVGARRRIERAGVTTEQFTPDEATETDANGFFVLSGLQGDRASVRAWGPGHTTAVERNVALGTGNLLLRVERHGSVAGVLRTADGKPIAGSRVRASARSSGRDEGELVVAGHDLDLPLPGRGPETRTAEDGSFRLDGVAPGTVTVSARGSSHRPVERAGVVVAAAQTTENVQLQAELGATARVKVTDDAGQPVAGARVRVVEPKQANTTEGGMTFRGRAIAVEDEGDGPQLLGDQREYGKGTTNAEGIAEIGGLPAGAATIVAAHTDLAEPKPADIVLPASGAVDATLAMRRPGWAAVAVTTPDGTAAAGARYVVHGPLGAGEDERDRPGTVDAQGLTRVGPLPPGDYWAELQLEPKPQSFGAGMAFTTGESKGLAQTRRRFQVQAGADVAVALQKPILTRVHGKVFGADGPVAGCEVELERQADDEDGEAGIPGFGAPSARTQADGSFELTEVEAGRYRLRWGKPGQVVKASEAVEVMPNQPELMRELQLRAGKLRVQAWSAADGEGIEGAEVELIEGGGSGAARRPVRRVMMVSVTMNNDGGESSTMTMGDQRAKTDADGAAEIADVPPGTYVVRITHDKHVAKEIPGQVVVESQTTDAGRAEMAAAGRLRARAVGADGKPANMAMLFCRKVGDAAEPRREPAIGGQATFTGLEPGRYAVKAQPLMVGPGGAGEATFGPEVEVEVKAGKTPATVEVQLPTK